jgi:preprotein translocase YajC subunit
MYFLIDSASAADEIIAKTAVETSAGGEPVPYDLSPEKMMRDNILILGVLFFIFYFLLIRPQQRRLKQQQDMIKSLKKGSKIITSGGIIGTIIKFEGDDIAVVEIAQDVRVRIAKSSISEVVDDKATSGTIANDN